MKNLKLFRYRVNLFHWVSVYSYDVSKAYYEMLDYCNMKNIKVETSELIKIID